MIKVNGPGYYKDGGLVINKPNMTCLVEDLLAGDTIFPQGTDALSIILDAKVITYIQDSFNSSTRNIVTLPIQDYLSDDENGRVSPMRVYLKTQTFPVYRWSFKEVLKKL